MLVLVSACALLDTDGRVLISKRPAGKHQAGLWEFPGGKIKEGEDPEQALRRELQEELGIEPCERCFQPFSFISHKYDDFHLLMVLYLCRQWDGIIHPEEGQELKWTFPGKLLDFDLIEADMPLARELAGRLKHGRFEG